MRIHILFAQRKCSYPGEYAPEVLTAWDENAVEENAEGWEEATTAAIKACGDQLSATRVVVIAIPSKEIDELLTTTPVLKGMVVGGD